MLECLTSCSTSTPHYFLAPCSTALHLAVDSWIAVQSSHSTVQRQGVPCAQDVHSRSFVVRFYYKSRLFMGFCCICCEVLYLCLYLLQWERFSSASALTLSSPKILAPHLGTPLLPFAKRNPGKKDRGTGEIKNERKFVAPYLDAPLLPWPKLHTAHMAHMFGVDLVSIEYI